MPTICPNCLRPVRNDVKFCGFCGANLVPAGAVQSKLALSGIEDDTIEQQPTSPERRKRTRQETRRLILIILVILLCLVLLVAFISHFWPVIIPKIGSHLSLLRFF